VIEEMARNPISWFRTKSKKWKEKGEEFWALKDVSFEVKREKWWASFGRNGAGKKHASSRFSVASQSDPGTHSAQRTRGLPPGGGNRLSPGTHRSREYLSERRDTWHGQGRDRRKFDEIVAFSEVEKFLDTPVKRYSSGMYVRLAFAVAAHSGT